jgi:hypothetical protein
MRPPPDLPRYLVEWYRSDLTSELLERTVGAIDRTARELAAEGSLVEHLLTLFVPADEVGFCLFAATSPASVQQLCRRAGLPFDRIATAIASPDTATHQPMRTPCQPTSQ